MANSYSKQHGPEVHRTSSLLLSVLAATLLIAFASAHTIFKGKAFSTRAPGIAVKGNQFVTTSAGTLGVQKVSAGQNVVLRGINFSGPEYECLSGKSVWDPESLPNGNSDYQRVINALLSWHANVVRIPLNEDCWLGVPQNDPPPSATRGAHYYGPIIDFINAANAAGLVAEVDLHFGAGPQLIKNVSDNFPAMDTSFSKAFWVDVAKRLGKNASVIFNLINEPQLKSSPANWSCYLSGGCTTKGYQSANGNDWTVEGTQSVVTAIRETGAKNPIIIAGLNFSNELDKWLSYVPHDPLKQIVAGVHIYFDLDCEAPECWNKQYVAIQKAGYPVVIDETGEGEKPGDTCTGNDEATLTSWADALPTTQGTPAVGYWFWEFMGKGGCNQGPDLLTDNTSFSPYPGYGVFAKTHLLSVQ